MVYDIGVVLSKAKVIYAEICVAPSEFMQTSSMSIDVFINALNDGRDRALRAWGVDMSWVLCIPCENPRVGDDVARWATSAAAKSGNVVALGLIGEENAQPVGQFKRAFATAHKKRDLCRSSSRLQLGFRWAGVGNRGTRTESTCRYLGNPYERRQHESSRRIRNSPRGFHQSSPSSRFSFRRHRISAAHALGQQPPSDVGVGYATAL